MSALPNCSKTDIFRKHLTSEILNSLWILPHQSHCFAQGTAEIRSMQQERKTSQLSKKITLPFHFLTTVIRVTSRYPCVADTWWSWGEAWTSRCKGRRAAMGDLASFGSFPQPQCKGRKGHSYSYVAAQFCPSQKAWWKCRQTPAAAVLKCFPKMREIMQSYQLRNKEGIFPRAQVW